MIMEIKTYKALYGYYDGPNENNIKILYIKGVGNSASSVKMSRDIYDSKFYETEYMAQKASLRAEKFVKEAYEYGFTCYGWDYDDNGEPYPTVESITTKIVKVKLISLE
jgi:hypothetical protein